MCETKKMSKPAKEKRHEKESQMHSSPPVQNTPKRKFRGAATFLAEGALSYHSTKLL